MRTRRNSSNVNRSGSGRSGRSRIPEDGGRGSRRGAITTEDVARAGRERILNHGSKALILELVPR
eukprot:5720092-Pyramimonas_sp.AAC.1